MVVRANIEVRPDLQWPIPIGITEHLQHFRDGHVVVSDGVEDLGHAGTVRSNTCCAVLHMSEGVGGVDLRFHRADFDEQILPRRAGSHRTEIREVLSVRVFGREPVFDAVWQTICVAVLDVGAENYCAQGRTVVSASNAVCEGCRRNFSECGESGNGRCKRHVLRR